MTEEEQGMTEEEALLELAQKMKDSTPYNQEKENVHKFLRGVVEEIEIANSSKLGNLRDDNELNELGIPRWNVRGALEMARLSEDIMDNDFFKDFFNKQANETISTSLSRDGFLIRQATTTTKQVADATKRRKINKGMFGKRTIEESGGDITQNK